MTVVPRTKKGRLLAVMALVVVLFVAATARLFAWPVTDAPTKVDAVVALGGDPGQRRAHLAVSLARAGYAPVAVISLGGYHPPCPSAPPKVQVICFRPDPLDTRGEAEYAAKLAARHGWKRLIVVPERTQSTRARLLFERCTPARLFIVPVADHPSHWIGDVFYEWGALLKALVLKRAC
ncbi:MAG TPA: YdcF family protein [Acidimicrobiales bacterium]|nr:YdcF family protein [Acidimicrobiales bacterium]